MKKQRLYTIVGILFISLSSLGSLRLSQAPKLNSLIPVIPNIQQSTTLVPAIPELSKVVASIIPALPEFTNASTMQTDIPAQPIVVNQIALKKIPFEQLPGWDKADVKKSLLAFQTSCQTFLKQKPSQPVGSQKINLKAKDWHPACKAALSLDATNEEETRDFFEQWFYPVELAPKKTPVKGVFTGYYTPQVKGSLTRTKTFNTPIYGLPEDLKWSPKKRYYTREQIDKGVIAKKAPVIAWINSPVDRLFLEIEGAAVIKLSEGKNLYLSYAGENGAPYTSIGNVMIKKGIMTKDNASKKAIQRYLNKHPKNVNPILHQNKSFVFFQNLKKPVALGAQGMALTPGYSLAIDRRWIPLGAPLWLVTKIPDHKDSEKQFKRLMIAQDTGGAIKGMMRGDIYWGAGERATYLGEHMKNKGRYWLLLPKHTFNHFEQNYFAPKIKLIIKALSHWPSLIRHRLL